MKRLSFFSALIILSSLIFSYNPVYAGDEEWATVGKILTGVVGGGIVYNIFSDSDCRPRHYPSEHYFSYGYYGPGISFNFGSDGYRYYPRGYYRYPRRHYRPRYHHRPYYGRRYGYHYRH